MIDHMLGARVTHHLGYLEQNGDQSLDESASLHVFLFSSSSAPSPLLEMSQVISNNWDKDIIWEFTSHLNIGICPNQNTSRAHAVCPALRSQFCLCHHLSTSRGILRWSRKNHPTPSTPKSLKYFKAKVNLEFCLRYFSLYEIILKLPKSLKKVSFV